MMCLHVEQWYTRPNTRMHFRLCITIIKELHLAAAWLAWMARAPPPCGWLAGWPTSPKNSKNP